MKLPAVSNPAQYTGLYVYDFGDHASIGYTAAEVRILLESPEHQGGTAYEIYRVNEFGGFELRGATPQRLAAMDAVVRLHPRGADARRDYELLRDHAEEVPIPAPLELHLARAYDFDPPDVVAMLFPQASASSVAAWLHGLPGPGHIDAGPSAYVRYLQTSGMRVASCQLRSVLDYTERPVEAVLGAVDRPCQR